MELMEKFTPAEYLMKPEPLNVTPMTKKDFNKFLKSIVDSKGFVDDFIDLEQKLTEALCDPNTCKERMAKFVSRIFDAFIYDLPKHEDQEVAKKSGGSLFHILFCLSLSSSLAEVQTRHVTDSKICVLLFGYAGSSVDDAVPQAEFYHDRGFSVISSTHCVYPHAFHQQQLYDIGIALSTIMKDDTKLIVHNLSGNGVTFWVVLARLWYWKVPPFDMLPPIVECWEGWINECWLGAEMLPKDYDPETTVDRSGVETYYSTRVSSVDDLPEGVKGISFFTLMDTIGSMCKVWCPDVNFHKLASTSPPIMTYIREGLLRGAYWYNTSLSGAQVPPKGYMAFSFQSCWGEPKVDLDILDCMRSKPIPRMFLFSEADALARSEFIEPTIEFARNEIQTKVFVTKLQTSLHCKLWHGEERDAAAQGVSEFLDYVLQMEKT